MASSLSSRFRGNDAGKFCRLARAMTFAQLFATGAWQAIANCPGRYRWASADVPAVEQLAPGHRFAVHRVPSARDEVLVAALSGGGGVISYRRPDGSLVHTLNDGDGFRRKLGQLGIALPPED